jgi:hypothetical protein
MCVAGAMAAVRVTMTVQLAASVMELVLNLLNKKRMIAMTLINWPFPQFPAVPWTKQQEQAYQQAQRNKYEESPL